MDFLVLWVPSRALSGLPWHLGSSTEQMSYNKSSGAIQGIWQHTLISFSATLKNFPIFPGFLRYLGSPMTAGIYPKKARLCTVIFPSSRAALLFQSVGFAKAWHTTLPKFWTYNQVEILTWLIPQPLIKVVAHITGRKIYMHDKEEQNTLLY